MKLTEMSVLMLFFLILIGIGVYFSRKALSTENDYWVAGRSVTGFIGSFAMFSTIASGSSLYGSVGSGVSLGLPFYIAYGLGAVSLAPFALFLYVSLMRKEGVQTLPEYFRKRYSKALQLISAIIVVFFMTLYIIPQLIAGGYIGSYVLNIPFFIAVIIIGAVLTIFSAIGGMWAITYTDFIQGAIMILGVGILSLFILVDVGSFSSLINGAVDINPDFVAMDLPWMSYFGIFFTFLMFAIVAPSAIMRNLSAKSVTAARRSMMGATILYLILFLLGLVILGAAVQLNVLDRVGNPDLIFLEVIANYLPPILAGVLLASIMASIMSSLSSFMLAISAAIAQDLYKGFINKNAEEKKVTKLGLIIMVVVGIITITLSLTPLELITVMAAWVSGGLVATFAAPILLGLWWEKATKQGAIVGVLGGFGCYVILMITSPFSLVSEVIVATPISFILMIIISFLTYKDPLINTTQGGERTG